MPDHNDILALRKINAIRAAFRAAPIDAIARGGPSAGDCPLARSLPGDVMVVPDARRATGTLTFYDEFPESELTLILGEPLQAYDDDDEDPWAQYRLPSAMNSVGAAFDAGLRPDLRA